MALSQVIRPASLLTLMILLALAGIANHDLWTPDEPREAAIALSMSKTGNYIVPELAGKPFVEKPPLFYIIAAFFLTILGPFLTNTTALRLTSACFGIGTLLFTYLIGKIYFGRARALLAAGLLATMIGFVHVSHWLVVDGALMFFITACIWALAKGYAGQRLIYLPLAGILAAWAFLTKGLIGPLIIFFAWLGLFIPWINKVGMPLRGIRASDFGGRDGILPSAAGNLPALPGLKFPSTRILGIHLLGMVIALSICAAWIIPFAMQGNPGLFREWWWTNHFGRFTGQSVHLGHIAPWYYYFEILPIYVLPWIVPFIIALFGLFKKIYRRAPLPNGGIFLLLWLCGAFLLLSFSATKRDIYLSLVLPACALLCAQGLEEDGETRLNSYRGLIIAAAIAWATLLIIACPIVDQFKSYSAAFKTTTAFLSSHPEIKAGGWNLDETSLAGFYYYGDLVFPVIPDRPTAEKILAGQHERFNALLTLQKNARSNDLPSERNQVIFQSRMGKRRLLQLIAAKDSQKAQSDR